MLFWEVILCTAPIGARCIVVRAGERDSRSLSPWERLEPVLSRSEGVKVVPSAAKRSISPNHPIRHLRDALQHEVRRDRSALQIGWTELASLNEDCSAAKGVTTGNVGGDVVSDDDNPGRWLSQVTQRELEERRRRLADQR